MRPAASTARSRRSASREPTRSSRTPPKVGSSVPFGRRRRTAKTWRAPVVAVAPTSSLPSDVRTSALRHAVVDARRAGRRRRAPRTWGRGCRRFSFRSAGLSGRPRKAEASTKTPPPVVATTARLTATPAPRRAGGPRGRLRERRVCVSRARERSRRRDDGRGAGGERGERAQGSNGHGADLLGGGRESRRRASVGRRCLRDARKLFTDPAHVAAPAAATARRSVPTARRPRRRRAKAPPYSPLRERLSRAPAAGLHVRCPQDRRRTSSSRSARSPSARTR